MNTPASPGKTTEQRVKGSRFIARVLPAADRQTVDRLLAEVREQYPDATHICQAYRLWGADVKPVEYSTDAGEPRGSAGVPMLNTLRRHELVDCLAWVVRYYGGTNLGIPGLIAAYGRAVENTMESVSTMPWIALVARRLLIPYPLVDRVKAAVIKAGGKILGEEYGIFAVLLTMLPVTGEQALLEQVQEWGGGTVRIDPASD